MIGVDISDRSIKIIRLSNEAHPKLLSHCWQELAGPVIERGEIHQREQLIGTLRAAFQACDVSPNVKDPIIASIPETQSFLRAVEVPTMSDGEVSEAIQWEVAQHIPFGVENMYIDWQLVEGGLKPNNNRREVLVGAAKKQIVDDLVSVLHELNLDVAALELESQAIVRSLISNELRQRQGLLVVDLGGSATNVIIHDHGTIRFTASLDRGAFELISNLSANQLAAVTGPPHSQMTTDPDEMAKALQSGFDELVAEIHGIVEFYSRTDLNHKVSEILLTGGGANLPGLDASFLRYFDDVHIQRGNPWVNILTPGHDTNPPLGLQESVHYSTAIGLALRQVTN